jgi:hypothetical protein
MSFSAFFPPRLLPHLCFFHALLCFFYSQPSITPFFLPCLPQLSSFLPFFLFMPFSVFFSPRLPPPQLSSFLAFHHTFLPFMPSLLSSYTAFHTLFFPCLSQLFTTWPTFGPFYLPCFHLPSSHLACILTFQLSMPSSAICSPSIHAHLSTLHAFICRLLP